MQYIDRIIVDNWEEVCRENTDIEAMHKHMGLRKEDTFAITDFMDRCPFDNLHADEVVMFNPMGMAVFDIAIGGLYYKLALNRKVGTVLA
jgi:ornithine cyclodeaminase